MSESDMALKPNMDGVPFFILFAAMALGIILTLVHHYGGVL